MASKEEVVKIGKKKKNGRTKSQGLIGICQNIKREEINWRKSPKGIKRVIHQQANVITQEKGLRKSFERTEEFRVYPS